MGGPLARPSPNLGALLACLSLLEADPPPLFPLPSFSLPAFLPGPTRLSARPHALLQLLQAHADHQMRASAPVVPAERGREAPPFRKHRQVGDGAVGKVRLPRASTRALTRSASERSRPRREPGGADHRPPCPSRLAHPQTCLLISYTTNVCPLPFCCCWPRLVGLPVDTRLLADVGFPPRALSSSPPLPQKVRLAPRPLATARLPVLLGSLLTLPRRSPTALSRFSFPASESPSPRSRGSRLASPDDPSADHTFGPCPSSPPCASAQVCAHRLRQL